MFHTEQNKNLLFTILLENYPIQDHDHLKEVFYYHFNDFQGNEHLVESNKRFLDMIHQSMIYKKFNQNYQINQSNEKVEKKKLTILTDVTPLDISFQEIAITTTKNKVFFDELFNLKTDFDSSMKTHIPEEINFKEELDDALEPDEMQKLVEQYRQNQNITPPPPPQSTPIKKVSFSDTDNDILKDKLQELKSLISEIEKLL